MTNETDHIVCPNCGAHVPKTFAFCGQCGRPLSDMALAPTAERRQITVMFCDLVGSVALARLLDPEDFAVIVRRYQDACVEAIEAHGGYVAQYLGDGILAYFGYPTADEHAAEQAVRAGLVVLGRMSALNRTLTQEYALTVSLRVGIHTGLAIVDEMGSGGRRERLALGETPNLAARLQSVAPTDSVVVSRDTYRLIADRFRCTDLGLHTLKGIDRPQPVYQVVEERFDTVLIDRWDPGEIPAISGRKEELAELQHLWDEAAAGRGSAVLISGEPGIGKSHLAHHFRGRIGSASHYCIASRCAPNMESSAFHPLVDWLYRVLNFYSGQAVEERLELLRFVAERNGILEDDAAPLLGALLSQVPLDDVSDLGYSPSRARERTEAVLEELVLSMAGDRPLLFIIEDVHWVDPSTRSFLLRLAGRIPMMPVLLLMTSRSGLVFEWPPNFPVSYIELERLSRQQITEVIAEAAGRRTLPKRMVARILEKADGIPLYAQEFAKMVLESTVDDGSDAAQEEVDKLDLTIPSTLQDLLMARLDRLMPLKEVAQVCSVFGRSFTADLVRAAAALPEATVVDALKRLVDAQLLVKERTPRGEQYVFRHALLQEAAYESMLRTRRAAYHRRIARYLIDSPEEGSRQAELIAYHLTRSGDTGQAALYWCRAGEEAQARWANEEAAEYFRRGLSLLEQLPKTEEHRRTAFYSNVGLAVASLQQQGYSHPDVASAFERAADLATDLKDAGASIPAILGLWTHYTVLSDHARAEILAERLSKLAPMAPEPLDAFSAMATRAYTWFWQGELGASRNLIESLLRRFDQLRGDMSPALSYQHPAIGSLSYLSLILWCQGDAHRAEEVGREAVRAAEEIGHPFSLAYACGFNSALNLYMGRHEAVREMAQRSVALAGQYGFPFWQAVGTVLEAWTRADEDPEGTVAIMEQGIGSLRGAGVRIWTSYPAALKAELVGRLGRPDAALEELDDVLAECELHGEYYFVPEMRRLRANLLDALGLEDEAHREREQAVILAQRQTARALALRVVNDIARQGGTPTPELLALMQSTVDSYASDADSPELEAARKVLSDAT